MSFRDAFRLVHAIPRATRTCDGAHTYLPGPVAVTLLYRPKREILPLLYRATRSHTRVAGNDIAVPSSNTICPPPLPLSPLPPFSLVRVGRKRRRWRLITTQSPLPVRPTPTRSEKGSNRLLPPRGIHYRCTGV